MRKRKLYLSEFLNRLNAHEYQFINLYDNYLERFVYNDNLEQAIKYKKIAKYYLDKQIISWEYVGDELIITL